MLNKESKMNKRQLERILTDQLENKILEELFEEFDLSPLEVFEIVYEAGMLDEEVLEPMLSSDFDKKD